MMSGKLLVSLPIAVATLATADVASLIRESSCAVVEAGATLRRRTVERAGRKFEGRIVAFGCFKLALGLD